MDNTYSYLNWLKYNSNSVTLLYNRLIEYNSSRFTTKNCSLNKFKYYCYLNSSKEKYKYL